MGSSFNIKDVNYMLNTQFDMQFENKLIKDYAKEIYEDFLSHVAV